MVPEEDSLPVDMASGLIAAAPHVGGIMAMLSSHGFKAVRDEWDRLRSKALRAAERASGMSREDLAERIERNPGLVPLVIRVLYQAGMTNNDKILNALGTALGDAIREPDRIDEMELLLIGLSDLRSHHIDVLRIVSENAPEPKNISSRRFWTRELVQEESGYTRDQVNICLTGLARCGFIDQVDETYGVCYDIGPLGLTALAVIDTCHEE